MAWDPSWSQDEFMLKDECLVLNYNDEIIGSDNKYNVHKFIAGQPKGVCHRAFSVMLFDGEGRLLLQQRAASKITFPEVWTNTCCSHPIAGQPASEVDDPPSLASAAGPMGVKRAAVRKLMHELGVREGALQPEDFKYMGRVHYWAADIVTHGERAPWGEHEIDYLLLLQLPKGKALELTPHPDEVMAIDWVTAEQLKAKMDVGLWSPWFRVIAREMLFPWWKDLTKSMKLPPYAEIRRFDVPAHQKSDGSHSGPAATELFDLAAAEGPLKWDSDARRALTLRFEREARRRDLTAATRSSAAAAANKQGAYGKVPTHSHSKLEQLMRPSEVGAGLYVKLVPGALKCQLHRAEMSEDLAFCDVKLGEVSRSFAAVIRQLPKDIAVDILIFYLVLRALDTIEDDMETFKGEEHVKCEHLAAFGEKYLGNESWSMSGIGEGAEEELLAGFSAVSRVFNTLPGPSREVIRDITNKMGAGMAGVVSVDMGQGLPTIAAFNEYCHHVAGLVGEGLTRCFIARGLEDRSIGGQGQRVWPFCKAPKGEPAFTLGIANSMGIFLQHANIIRDYLEDYADGRAFWPQEAWRKFARTNELGEFARPTAHGAGIYAAAFDAKLDPQGAAVVGKGSRTSGLDCLNSLIGDSLELVPDCLEYLNRLKTPEIFRFSAIPQVMAIATLEACFNNPLVFTGVVKIRKGLAAKLMLDSATTEGVHYWFDTLARDIADATPAGDPSRAKILAACAAIHAITGRHASTRARRSTMLLGGALVAAAAAASVCLS